MNRLAKSPLRRCLDVAGFTLRLAKAQTPQIFIILCTSPSNLTNYLHAKQRFLELEKR